MPSVTASPRRLPGRARTDLLGHAVLLVVDNFYEARDIQQALQHAGALVVRPCADLKSAPSLAEGELRCAILDLCAKNGFPVDVAEALAVKGVPLIFVAGFGSSVIPEKFSEVPVLQKPVDLYALLRLTAKLIGKGGIQPARR
jgi:hypothetical protein